MYVRCIGSTQHLKSKYGSEYMLEMKAAVDWQTSGGASSGGTDAWFAHLDRSMNEMFARSCDVKLMEHVGDHVVYRVPRDCFGQLSDVFTHLEQRENIVCDFLPSALCMHIIMSRLRFVVFLI